MIEEKDIRKIVESNLDPKEYFVIEIQNKADKIKVIMDGYQRSVDLDHCAAVTRELREGLGEKADNYDIEVSSPGLSEPFRVKEQYQKNIGEKIEILLNSGEKLTGKLLEVNPDDIQVEEKKRIKTEKKKKKTVREQHSLRYDEIKYTKLIISF